MKIVKLTPNGPSCILMAFLMWGSSCTPETIDLDSIDSANIQNETDVDTYFADSEDISAVTVSSDNATNGGRVAGGARLIIIKDPRLVCATVTLVPSDNSTFLFPRGLLTVDFGVGCTDNHGNVRKGKITVAYNGRRFLPGSSVVTTLIGYQINGIRIEGMRSVLNASNSSQSDPRFTTTMTGGTITWPDGSTVLRDESVTRELKLGVTAAENQWLVTGSATGKNRKDLDYSMNITTSLLYKQECAINSQVYMAVKGIKELVVSGKKITVDYGDGSCDKSVTVTIKSKSKVLTLGNN